MELHSVLQQLFTELTDGAPPGGGAYILNSGDAGARPLAQKLSATNASHAVDGGATIAAHAQHLRYGLSLMNRWAREGGNPFADAKWDEAWKVSAVSTEAWTEIRSGLADEIRVWRESLGEPREVAQAELAGMVATVAHLAYHLGAMRQIARGARGPREGTFA